MPNNNDHKKKMITASDKAGLNFSAGKINSFITENIQKKVKIKMFLYIWLLY